MVYKNPIHFFIYRMGLVRNQKLPATVEEVQKHHKGVLTLQMLALSSGHEVFGRTFQTMLKPHQEQGGCLANSPYPR